MLLRPSQQLMTQALALCRGDQHFLETYFTLTPKHQSSVAFTLLGVGLAAYGSAMGLAHGMTMASFVAIKLPLIVIFTLIINGLLNGLIAILSGSGLGFKQSFQFLFASFGLMGLILASLTPIAWMHALGTPPPSSPDYAYWHRGAILGHVLTIAIAGVLAHWKLYRFLQFSAKTPSSAKQLFASWLIGNLFVGTQVSWVLRPVFGSPGLEPAFLRENPLNGSFYEAIYFAAQKLFF